MSYVKINWQNGEEGQTPLNAENLNKMDNALYTIDTTKLNSKKSIGKHVYTCSNYIDRMALLSEDAFEGSIMLRDKNGNTSVREANGAQYIANKQQVDNAKNNSVQKMSKTGSFAYGHENDIDDSIEIKNSISNNTVCQRNNDGIVTVPDPTSNEVASNKGYFDAKSIDVKVDVSSQKKKLDNLFNIIKGDLFVEQNGTSPAYTDIVPEGSQKYAELKMIGGKSVFWNQLIKNGNMTSTGNWAKQPATTSINIDTDNNILTFTMPENAAQGSKRIYEVMEESVPAEHKVLMRFDIKTDGYPIPLRYGISNGSALGSGSASVLIDSSTIAGATDWTTIANIFERDVDCTHFVLGSLSGTGPSPVVWQIRRVNLFDLTVMFGAGNEPTTIEEFNKEFPNLYYGTSSNVIKSAICNRVVSKNPDNEIISQYDIPEYIKTIDGYGESNGNIYNYLDIINKKYVSFGRYIDDQWIAYSEPVETDVSDYVTDDNFIEVIESGSLIFEQNNDIPLMIPNTITYLVELSFV